MRGIVMSGLATVVILSLTMQPATPSPDDGSGGFPKEPHTTTASCDDLTRYTEDFYAILEDHSTYTDFWNSGDYDTIQQQDRADIQDIVDDGQAMLEDIEDLDVPEMYAPGQDGILMYFGSDVDYISFLGIDASVVPNFDEFDTSLAFILHGEILAAKTCPDEVEEAGGYIFLPIDDLEDALSD